MKHKEIAKAWLDGAEVECKQPSGEWTLLNGPNKLTYMFSFHDRYEYRIKPKTATFTFKFYKSIEGQIIGVLDRYYREYDDDKFFKCISEEQTVGVTLKS